MSEPEQVFPPAPDGDVTGAGAIAIPAEPATAEETAVRHGLRHLNAARGMRQHLRAVRMVLNALLLLALLYTITLTKALLIPLVLAAFIGLALNPIVAFGTRIRLPRWLTASVLMLGLIVGIGSGVGLLAQPAIGWFHGAPTAIKSFVPKLRSFTKPLEAANRATQTLVSSGTSTRAAVPQSAPVSISAWDVVSTAPKVLAAVLSVMLLVFFFLIYGDSMLRRLVQITPGFAYKRHAVTIVRGIQTEVSRYLLTALLINAGLGAITAGMLWLYKVPDPLLWGAVAMFANFIPYVGAIVTTTVLAVVCMLYANDASLEVFLPVLTFAGITAVEGNLITPMIQGASMRLSPIAILLWLLVWGWLWGIPGALLAVPMLTCTKLITERVRGWEWFAHIVQR
ncbi:AI-2E family transporter [Rhodanobacter denitrificans]|uniref:Putative permease n=1 Tax=Rhodanobacter denitrificans TaxID=666685 RepID=M4NBT9_9GAMM|nr:AI-2E family transporter [Rhodanobacter denitrificans]AGG87242.1 putative permease [Rhodanobacter denitrificans]UJM86429.1 AI-2E family transporter [Rhodanobacter denitrificans]